MKAVTLIKKEQRSRLALTLLFGGAVLIILLAVVSVTAAGLFTLVNTGLLSQDELSSIAAGNRIVLLMIPMSVITGIIFAFLLGKIFTKPLNTVIDMMQRLASGHFDTRLSFDSVFAKHPTVVELTDSINTMAAELENTEMLRDDFINNFSHEFKTPIVSIAGFAKLLKSGNLTEEQKLEYINIIEEESLRLSDMASRVLELTKVENQHILSNLSYFNLSEQIRDCFLLLENKWAEKRLRLELDYKEYTIQGDEELLKQVWINLIDNAVKFTPEEGLIRVDIEDQTDMLAVSVTNSGSHIMPEDRERIFRKFYQADKSHATKGSGVGLAVVRRVVDLHSGHVTVSEGEGGVCFTVILPKDISV